ncbi:MAG: hypothetical protein MJ175_03455 [Clostridia bacterium]|nr:hypothetical protein [Clostridia bacterium]
MKKFLALILAVVMLFAMVSCGAEKTEAPDVKSEGVMTYAEYAAAALDAPVVIETYVQAKQSWWDNKATVYTQDKDGAYFLYNMTCSEEDYAKLVPGTKIKVTGFKAEWAGEIEVAEGATFEIIPGATYVAPAFDATALLGTDDLIKHQNEFVSFKGLTVDSIEFKNGEPGDDIYVNVKKGEDVYGFCVEFYLTGADTDVYKAVSALNAGDVVDIEGFLYWYNGVNTHITSCTAAK